MRVSCSSSVCSSCGRRLPARLRRDLRGTARAGDRPQPNAVVWLEVAQCAAEPQKPSVPSSTSAILSFSPHVLAVRVRAAVDFPNNDRVFHNVFSFRDGKKFDLGLYPVGVQKPVVFDKPGLSRDLLQYSPEHGRLRARRRQPVSSASRTIAEAFARSRWSLQGASRITRGVLAART